MKDEKLPVIILAGWSCSGKSTTAKKLVDITSFDLIEVYKKYHRIAVSKGYRRSREWLYDVGGVIFSAETFLRIARYITILKCASKHTIKGFIIDASFGAKMNFLLRKKVSNIHIINIAVLCKKEIRLNRMGIALMFLKKRQEKNCYLETIF